jgi:hypothetical protein
MTHVIRYLPVVLLIAASLSPLASADSGLIRLSELAGPWRVTVMTDPTPVRAGPVDFAVLLQDVSTGKAILDADVQLRLRNDERGLTWSATATRSQADNRLLYAAKFTLPASGRWTVGTQILAGGMEHDVQWAFTAAEPIPPFTAAWPWLLPAPIGIALYAASRILRKSPSP